MSKHHNIAKDCWGENIESNYTELTQEQHRRLHMLFNTMPPHMMIEYILKIWCEPIKEEIKEEIMKIIDIPSPENLYKPKTIKTIERFKAMCFKYLRIKYIKI